MSARSFSKKKSKTVEQSSSPSASSASPRSPGARPDVYTVMTILAFVGMVAATVLVYLQVSKLTG